MQKPMILGTPMAALYKRLEEGKAYASHGGDPIPDQTIINMALTNLQKIPEYNVGICKWHRRDAADKTWTDFKRFFVQKTKEVRRELEGSSNPY